MVFESGIASDVHDDVGDFSQEESSCFGGGAVTGHGGAKLLDDAATSGNIAKAGGCGVVVACRNYEPGSCDLELTREDVAIAIEFSGIIESESLLGGEIRIKVMGKSGF